MATPNPLAPTKGAGTTLWVYAGTGDPYANPLSDVDWLRLAKIKDLQPGELTAESEDDTYIDDKNADWTSTMQGQKSAGETNLTLACRMCSASTHIISHTHLKKLKPLAGMRINFRRNPSGGRGRNTKPGRVRLKVLRRPRTVPARSLN